MIFKKSVNNKFKKDKFSEKTIEKIVLEEFGGNFSDIVYDNDKVDEGLENILKLEEIIKERLLNKKIIKDPYFDQEIYKHLDILHKFVNGYIDCPPYYDPVTLEINGLSFLHSRDIIKNELPLSVDMMLNLKPGMNGVVNDTLLNFENGFSMDENGNIYDEERECIFNRDPHQKIKELDLVNKKIVTENWVRIDMPDNFFESLPLGNEILNKIEEWKNGVKSDKPIYAIVNGNEIYDKELIKFPLEDVFLGDIFEDPEEIDLKEQIKRYTIDSKSFGTCNFQEIPYGEMNSLLIWGGGEKGVKPLASSELTDKDIKFSSDGTAYYSGESAIFNTKRSGCKSKTYKTGHAMMWSESNKVGLRKSIIQYLYGFGAAIGLFNANIPALVGFKSFKVFPGLCIGGYVEMLLCKWQEEISEKINGMFKCVPMQMPSDLTQSGFDNSTYLYGATVSKLGDLDELGGVKYGDRFVVEVVEPAITGNKDIACGVFIFDPERTLISTHRWRYKNFSGKPFKQESPEPIISYENAYENAKIQEVVMETNALGVDSITKKIMSLEYAYLKKEVLLSARDVETSVDAIVRNVIFEMLDKLTLKISDYCNMEDMHIRYPQEVQGYESKRYCEEFFRHFKYLEDYGALKMPVKEDYLKKYRYTEGFTGGLSGGNNERNGSYTTYEIEYYDFTKLDPEIYIVPKPSLVSKYDTIMFSMQLNANKELADIFERNTKYLENVGKENKYKAIKTIRDFLNTLEGIEKQQYDVDIKDNLQWISRDLAYEEYEPNAFSQVEKRCYYCIDTNVTFNI